MSKETRQDKFRRIAEKRMTRIFSDMNLIANLSNRNNYVYSDQDVEELFQAYEAKGKEIRLYFDSEIPIKQPLSTSFSFSDKDKSNIAKNNKFKIVAEKRMDRIFSDMNLIANLSNKKNYNYSSQEIDELFQAYEDKGKEIRRYFEPLKKEFTFSK
ncbi:hypothetical protein [Bacillus velezensis]|uniref:hypothetical protein n=1 Tax=Bacillus velezensis TaxID=492670 RepID=UPI001F22A725|nr:hypothetical protein [Bacillus velezensis]UJA36493.1 hypothetical protein L0961_03280 [Bacillus velezensis]WGD60475.1 hypothetical protein P5660_01100 [Bacillus velezensis]